ncbi:MULTISPECIES: esterase-like activity of phytase family protein [unclassified Novosphingobium]|uniref:esterase-like activity of phytase family protein n=1 Tax=unclassified Novosphingobium TaxID=2644732 RepID=UPI0025D7879A|nr:MULTISPECIES: esterase-like activity of phytase family protein [unclassified Novosphingobium]HQV04620.1 esterase-like activity of phytase family protein [Novosphingobium sp.]
MIHRLAWTDVPLESVPTPKGEMALHRSLTSGLCRRAGDPVGTFWGIGDRGPNIKPKDAVKRYGLDHLAKQAGLEGAKVMPTPDVGPALARFRLVGERIELEAVLPLHAADGTPLNGLPPPELAGAETEPAFALDGSPLPSSPDGADSEGIAARSDGMFWIAEEYGPSLLLVDEAGLVHHRLIPQGSAARYAGSRVPVVEALPALAAARKLNRGFEALAMRPDGATLYAAFQSPLAHPDRAAHDAGDVLRIWALDATSAAFQAEYAYPLDPPESFRRDRAAGPVVKSDVKVSELAALADGSLLVLERVTLSTHIYQVSLGEALPAEFLDPAHRPTLEQLGRGGVALLAKERVFSSDDHPDVCGDLEGMIVLDDGSLLLSNDSDYGTEGAVTQFWRVKL